MNATRYFRGCRGPPPPGPDRGQAHHGCGFDGQATRHHLLRRARCPAGQPFRRARSVTATGRPTTASTATTAPRLRSHLSGAPSPAAPRRMAPPVRTSASTQNGDPPANEATSRARASPSPGASDLTSPGFTTASGPSRAAPTAAQAGPAPARPTVTHVRRRAPGGDQCQRRATGFRRLDQVMAQRKRQAIHPLQIVGEDDAYRRRKRPVMPRMRTGSTADTSPGRRTPVHPDGARHHRAQQAPAAGQPHRQKAPPLRRTRPPELPPRGIRFAARRATGSSQRPAPQRPAPQQPHQRPPHGPPPQASPALPHAPRTRPCPEAYDQTRQAIRARATATIRAFPAGVSAPAARLGPKPGGSECPARLDPCAPQASLATRVDQVPPAETCRPSSRLCAAVPARARPHRTAPAVTRALGMDQRQSLIVIRSRARWPRHCSRLTWR